MVCCMGTWWVFTISPASISPSNVSELYLPDDPNNWALVTATPLLFLQWLKTGRGFFAPELTTNCCGAFWEILLIIEKATSVLYTYT